VRERRNLGRTEEDEAQDKCLQYDVAVITACFRTTFFKSCLIPLRFSFIGVQNLVIFILPVFIHNPSMFKYLISALSGAECNPHGPPETERYVGQSSYLPRA
jgi:hypothetical protein